MSTITTQRWLSWPVWQIFNQAESLPNLACRLFFLCALAYNRRRHGNLSPPAAWHQSLSAKEFSSRMASSRPADWLAAAGDTLALCNSCMIELLCASEPVSESASARPERRKVRYIRNLIKICVWIKRQPTFNLENSDNAILDCKNNFYICKKKCFQKIYDFVLKMIYSQN